jgi:heme/copper-type cytochrome/quinol oxidase subunit 2
MSSNSGKPGEIKTVKRSTFIAILIVFIIIVLITTILAVVFFIQYRKTYGNLENNICPVCA